MISWKERLCGSVALKSVDEEAGASITQIMNPSDVMSCGGVWYKTDGNSANMKTFKNNFVLPTDNYSVMLFNQEGNAVIFSDGEAPVSSDDGEMSQPMLFPKFLN